VAPARTGGSQSEKQGHAGLVLASICFYFTLPDLEKIGLLLLEEVLPCRV
jgi:hypothetical protein